MKNIYLFIAVLFLEMTVQAQIVNIPDANFKAKLLQANTSNSIASNTSNYDTPMLIDANLNGEIEVSEALLVRAIYVNNSNISSLAGIESFANLRKLYCSNNSLTVLDVNSLSFLRQLDCSHNSLSGLNCQDIENSMDILDCSYNNLTSLILPNFYEFLDMGDQVMYANCSHNQLFNIIIQNNEQFSLLNLSYNNLTTLSFNNLEIYGSLLLSNNPLTSINLDSVYVGSQTPDYQYGYFECNYTNITELHIPFYAANSSISSNPYLISLNIKNGKRDFDSVPELDENGEETGNYISYGAHITNNPQLALICVDAIEVGYYIGVVPSTVQVNQNCSLGVLNEVKYLFKIYPNPTSGTVTILFSDNQTVKATISNLLGQTIMTFNNITELDMSSLTKGTYFITVETDKGKETQRVIKL